MEISGKENEQELAILRCIRELEKGNKHIEATSVKSVLGDSWKMSSLLVKMVF